MESLVKTSLSTLRKLRKRKRRRVKEIGRTEEIA